MINKTGHIHDCRANYSLVLIIGYVLYAASLPVLSAPNALPQPVAAYSGKLDPRENDSTPLSPAVIKAPDNAPNVVLVMTDDVGFGSSSTFGGSVPTPNLDRLAANGLRYNRFHTTGVCSPTRAALLTGRNHHAAGVGTVPESISPFPGYTGEIRKSAASIARILRDNGYNTAMIGKEHNIPSDERSASGPFDQWPTGRGFEYFYGFVTADTDQFKPSLYEGTTAVSTHTRSKDAMLDKDLVDKAIGWLHNQQANTPDKPFFLYYATGSAHAPQQAPKEWIAQFRGKFDHGWDKEREQILAKQIADGIVPAGTQLAPKPDIIPDWDDLTKDQQAVYARFMEVYAAVLAYQDAQFGRLLDELERMSLIDNTLILFIQGDNGSSGEGSLQGALNEAPAMVDPATGYKLDFNWLADNLDVLGGPDTYQVFPVGWAFATSTPFPWVKQLASHLGAVRNGLVVSWPQQIQPESTVHAQYHHVIDIAPTILEATGISAPDYVDGIKQQAIDGTSMLYSFNNVSADDVRTTQYYEIFGNRAIYHAGWMASTTPKNMPWIMTQPRPSSDPASYQWELYDLRKDFSQSNNLAKAHPEKLQQLKTIFDTEARKNNVYPIQDSGAITRTINMAKLARTKPRNTFVYWGAGVQVGPSSIPPIAHRSFTIEAEINITEKKAQGVILAAGSHFGGWAFYLDNKGRPAVSVSTSALPGGETVVSTNQVLPQGRHTLLFQFERTRHAGQLTIQVDGKQIQTAPIKQLPVVLAGLGETLDIGLDRYVQVTDAYQNAGVFSGEIKKVTVSID